MNGILAPALLCATFGMMLSFGVSRRAIASGLVATIASGLVAAHLPIGAGHVGAARTACWIGVVAAAAGMHLHRPTGQNMTGVMGLIAGLAAGSTVAASGMPSVLPAIVWVLSCVPGAWLVSTRRGLAVKVAGSWLAAAAVLSLGLGTVPTLGYEPDHME